MFGGDEGIDQAQQLLLGLGGHAFNQLEAAFQPGADGQRFGRLAATSAQAQQFDCKGSSSSGGHLYGNSNQRKLLMMATTDYKAFLDDFVSEVLELTKDESLYTSGDAYSTGYRSALYAVLNLLEGQAIAWDLRSEDVGLRGFSPDKWRKEGIEYCKNEGGPSS